MKENVGNRHSHGRDTTRIHETETQVRKIKIAKERISRRPNSQWGTESRGNRACFLRMNATTGMFKKTWKLNIFRFRAKDIVE
jgi:hypothetical protein